MTSWLSKQDDRVGPHPYWVYVLIWAVIFPAFAVSLILMAIFL